MAEEEKKSTRKSKNVEEKATAKPVENKKFTSVKSAQIQEVKKNDEFQELRERLKRDYKGRLTNEQIEQRIELIRQSKENK